MDYIKSFYTSPPTIHIIIDASNRKTFKYPNKLNKLIEYPTFYNKDLIKGKLIIELNKNKNLEHQGIIITLIGIIENIRDSSLSSKFYDESITLTPPSKLNNEITQLDFTFPSNAAKKYETYFGNTIRVHYYLYACIKASPKVYHTQSEIVILNPYQRVLFDQEDNPPLKLEIGIENLIHVVLEIQKSNYHLRDVIIGKVVFVDVNIKLINMEVQIIRKENVNCSNNNVNSECTVMARYVVMDGTPKKGSVVPIRYYLNGIRCLTPSFVNVDNKFSVQYYLHVEFLDCEERRFFKRMEIKLMRLNNMNRKDVCLFKKE